METFSITDILLKRAELPKKKIDFEFQQVCLDCEEYFGKNKLIWCLPYKVNCTENIIRDSLKVCKTGGKDFKYFMGIIRNKTNVKK